MPEIQRRIKTLIFDVSRRPMRLNTKRRDPRNGLIILTDKINKIPQRIYTISNPTQEAVEDTQNSALQIKSHIANFGENSFAFDVNRTYATIMWVSLNRLLNIKNYIINKTYISLFKRINNEYICLEESKS